MTQHPHQLHARAALWSIRAAWPRLAAAAAAAARAIADHGDRGTLQAWRPSSGPHHVMSTDAILDAIIRESDLAVRPFAERARLARQTVAWVATAVLGADRTFRAGVDGDLAQLLDRIPRLPPAAAGHVARWIDEQDRAIRQLLGAGDDQRLLPEDRCPVCGAAGVLALRASAPERDRVVVCTAGCSCPGCACGLPAVWTPSQIQAAA